MGALVEAAVQLTLREGRSLLVLTALAVVPAQALGLLVQVATLPAGVRYQDGGFASRADAVGQWFLLSSAAASLLGAAATLVVAGLAWRTLSAAAAGGHAGWRESLRAAAPRLGALLFLAVLTVLGLVAAAFMLLLPAIWLGVAWAVAVPALMAEDQHGGAALARSYELVRGRWWRTLGALLLGALLGAIVATVASQLLVGLVPADGPAELALAVRAGGATVGALVATPLQVALVAVVFMDLRGGVPIPAPGPEPEPPRWLPPVA